MLTIKLIGAALFILTGGAVFSDRFRKYRLLAAVAGVVSIVAAYFLVKDIAEDLADQRIAGEVGDGARNEAAPAGGQAPPAAMPPAAEQICGEAKREWETASDDATAAEVRDFLGAVSPTCLALRASISSRLRTLEIQAAAQAEEAAYVAAIGARTRTSYASFLADFPASRHAAEIHRRLSTCRQVLAPTGAYADKEIGARGEVFDSMCRNIADCDSYDAAARRAVGRCRQNLSELCRQIGGEPYNYNDLGVRGLGVSADCAARCRIPETAYQEQCE